MADAVRYPCPVCLGVTMEKVKLGADDLALDCCRRCGGAWFEAGEVTRVRALARAELRKTITGRTQPAPAHCHKCHGVIDRDVERCPSCGWRNRIDCPACQRPTERQTVQGVTLDACKTCKGVWFDHAELSAVWSLGLAALVAAKPAAAQPILSSAPTTADVVVDALIYAPDLVYLGARGAVELASVSGQLLTSAPEAAGSVIGALGDAAGAVFGAILEVIGAIFEGLSF